MAKAKKKESTLTLEEKLVQAFVPESEQPYKVPKNWCWVRLGKTVVLKRGASPRPIKAFVTELDGGINWIKIGDTNSGKYIDAVKEKITVEGKEKSVFVEKGTLLLSNSMSFGRPYILNVDGCIHDGWLAISTKETFEKEYLYYALLASNWYFEQVAVGTAVRNLNTDRVSNTPIVCPPLAEQRRIVERIESLFAKLDEAKEKLQEVLDGFETRKGAILHKAFTGELTAKWREENGVSLDSWEYTNLGKYASSQYGFTESATNEIVGPHFLRITDIQNGKVDWKSVPYCKIDREIKNKYKLNVGDIVVARTGATTGKSYLVTDDVDAVFASFLIRVTVEVNKVDYNYVYWFMQSQHYWMQITELSSGIAQPGVNGKKLVGLRIPVPSISEQTVIVGLLDAEWQYEQNAKRMVEDAYNQIDILKKAILARAFRGELGTNDENDECAVELLKRVL